MPTPTSAEIRQAFLDFFCENGHEIVPSAPLVQLDVMGQVSAAAAQLQQS